MKAKVSFILMGVILLGYANAFAVEVTGTDGAKIGTSSNGGASVSSSDLDVGTSSTDGNTTVTPAKSNSLGTTSDTGSENGLNAASGKDVIVAPKGSIGNYSEVACDKDYFTSNSCNQCFEGGKKMVGEKIAGLTDSWTNPNATEQVIYKDEQKWPELINLGGDTTTWANNPQDSTQFWKYNDEIVWTDSATGQGKQEFLLEAGKTVNFLEADLGASYALQATDKLEGDPVGLLKFYVNYHDTDATAKETEGKIHTECVVYYGGTPAPAPAPVAVTPPEATKVKTGPESYILIIVALILSFGLLKYRKKA